MICIFFYWNRQFNLATFHHSYDPPPRNLIIFFPAMSVIFNFLLYCLLMQTAGGLSPFSFLSSPHQEDVVNPAYVPVLEILPSLPTPTHETLILLLSRMPLILDTMSFMFNGWGGRESCRSLLDIYVVNICKCCMLHICPDTIL